MTRFQMCPFLLFLTPCFYISLIQSIILPPYPFCVLPHVYHARIPSCILISIIINTCCMAIKSCFPFFPYCISLYTNCYIRYTSMGVKRSFLISLFFFSGTFLLIILFVLLGFILSCCCCCNSVIIVVGDRCFSNRR